MYVNVDVTHHLLRMAFIERVHSNMIRPEPVNINVRMAFKDLVGMAISDRYCVPKSRYILDGYLIFRLLQFEMPEHLT